MSNRNDKYADESQNEATSDVRGIISQLNSEHPSKEKKREVVIRPDGTKVIRVTKKRRVLVSEKEKRRAGRRSFLLVLLGAVVLCLCVGAYLLFSMTTMSGEAYVQKKAEELRDAWGATKVEIVGTGVSGTSFHLTSLTADFPESSLVQHVELFDISGELDTITFFSKTLTSDEIKVARATLRLNPALKAMKMPLQQGGDLWHVRRLVCPNFSLSYGEGDAAPVAVENATAYLYYPRMNDRSACSFVLSKGVLRLRGMQPIRLDTAKFLLEPKGIEEFSISGTTDDAVQLAGREETSLTITGRLGDGDSFEGPFEFDSDNMSFGDFTQKRFENILSARTLPQAIGTEHSKVRMLMPVEQPRPEFSGDFRLKNISLIGFPAENLLLEHMVSSKRKNYQPAKISQGHVILAHDGDTLALDFPADGMVERDLIALRGRLELHSNGELSGTMDYGLPTILTHAEYTDGKSDPIFREDIDTAWLCTTVSGTINVPGDNSAQLNAEAQTKRAEMPDRMSLEDVDLDKVAEQLKKEQEQYQQLKDADQDESKKRALDAPDPFADPLENK